MHFVFSFHIIPFHLNCCQKSDFLTYWSSQHHSMVLSVRLFDQLKIVHDFSMWYISRILWINPLRMVKLNISTRLLTVFLQNILQFFGHIACKKGNNLEGLMIRKKKELMTISHKVSRPCEGQVPVEKI